MAKRKTMKLPELNLWRSFDIDAIDNAVIVRVELENAEGLLVDTLRRAFPSRADAIQWIKDNIV